MRLLVEWLLEQRAGVAIVIFAITLVLRYGFDLWWPWGIAMATVSGIVGLFAGKST